MSSAKENPELFRAFQEGDRDALGEYYQAHYNALFGYSLLLTESESLAEDFTADAFYILAMNPEKVSNERHLRGYLFKTVKNLHRTHRREKEREDAFIDEAAYQMADGLPVFAEWEAIKAEALVEVQESMLRLTEWKRRIVFLYYFMGWTSEKIGRYLNISSQTVLNHLSQSVGKLREDICQRGDNNNPLFT